MSLRSRILGLYVLLALVAMVVGVGYYIHAVRSLENLVRSKLQALSDNAASQILDRKRTHELTLAQFAAAEVAATNGFASPVQTRAERAPRLSADQNDDFTRIEFRDAGGSTVSVVRGDTTTRSAACGTADADVSMVVPVNDRRSTIRSATARVRATALLPREALEARLGRTGVTLVLERTSGEVLYDSECERGGTAYRPWLQEHIEQSLTSAGRGSLTRVVHGTEKGIGYASLTEMPWVVVSAVDMAEFKAPYAGAQRLYLFIVLASIALIGGGFVLLARHYMESLAQLSAAADRIGAGDLMPWLPPPGRDEVGRLSHGMAVMLARLKHTMRQSEIARKMAVAGEVAAQLSHEIRNPLSSIKLNLQSVEREVRAGSVPDDLHHVLGLCLREIERLDNAVTTVLDCGRPGQFDPRPCRLDGIVDESLDLMRPRLAQNRIALERERRATSDEIAGDPALLRAALLNLFLNAMDAMPQGGTLRVRTEEALDETGRAEVRVHVGDTGPGVRPDERDLIFQPFFTTKRSGSGIGLPLAVQTVEAHGGRLYLETRSELDGGAEFVLALPALVESGTREEDRADFGLMLARSA